MHSKLLHMGSKLASRSTGQDLWKHEWTRGWGKLFTNDKGREECMGGEPKGAANPATVKPILVMGCRSLDNNYVRTACSMQR